MTFRHVVLFRVRDEVTDPEVSDAIAALKRLGDWASVTAWTVVRSIDERKGRVIVEDGSFTDRIAFEEWRGSPQHRDVAERLSTIADWVVGDWEDHADEMSG